MDRDYWIDLIGTVEKHFVAVINILDTGSSYNSWYISVNAGSLLIELFIGDPIQSNGEVTFTLSTYRLLLGLRKFFHLAGCPKGGCKLGRMFM